ncbi:ArsR/SmtB family transcription factor [Indioceanicola profundi]|uniref:ArsR/SmtB family transcription factor n=1 Tax=Indioceanicola profundi TaxID=2220096 RepID=UPI000E6A983C|nr:metalloregulator ArsR/SmtB family transcription factor [Indioceanicola profundi]
MSSTTPAAQQDRRSLGLQTKLFRGLADPSRLSILEALRAGPRTVGEIVAATGLSQSNTSNHLRCLSECGLVAGEQRGRFVQYALADPRIKQLLALADQLLEGAAQGVDRCENYENGSST